MSHQQEFEKLHQLYNGMVMQLCLGFAQGSMMVAKDLSQDLFIHIWHALPRFQARSNYKTWIYRITTNTCLTYIRKAKKLPLDPLADEDAEIKFEGEEDHNYAALYKAIGQLSDVDRILIMLVLDDLTYEEIGEVLGIKQTNLRVKIHRVKEKLKTLMSHE